MICSIGSPFFPFMKRIVPGFFCLLVFITFTAFSLAAEMGAPSAAEHVSWAADHELIVEMMGDATADGAVSPEAIVSTRSSFTARWKPVSQTASYRLDVSLSPSFDSYVTGYHGLEVGPATWQVVTGLSPG